MPGTGKKRRGEKRMTKTGAAMRIEEPASGAAGEAGAAPGGISDGPHANSTQAANHSDASAAGAQGASPPKTVSQVLGEIT